MGEKQQSFSKGRWQLLSPQSRGLMHRAPLSRLLGQVAARAQGLEQDLLATCALLTPTRVSGVSRPGQHNCEMSFLQLKLPASSITYSGYKLMNGQ